MLYQPLLLVPISMISFYHWKKGWVGHFNKLLHKLIQFRYFYFLVQDLLLFSMYQRCEVVRLKRGQSELVKCICRVYIMYRSFEVWMYSCSAYFNCIVILGLSVTIFTWWLRGFVRDILSFVVTKHVAFSLDYGEALCVLPLAFAAAAISNFFRLILIFNKLA